MRYYIVDGKKLTEEEYQEYLAAAGADEAPDAETPEQEDDE